MTSESITALTLWQPWASLCATGHKAHETRSWTAPARILGTRIAIHAAKAMPSPSSEMMTPELLALCEATFGADWRTSLPKSAIVCTAVVEASLPTDALRGVVGDDDIASGVWTDGRFAWRLTDLQMPEAPIHARGAQGLWRWIPQDDAGMRLIARGPTPSAQGSLDLDPR
jgi:hypothetical protein